MAVFLGLYWTVFTAALLSSSSLALRIPFLRRYEPLSYDLDSLSSQHHRLRERSADEDPHLSLQFTAMHRPFDLVLVPDTSLFHKNLTVSSSRGPLPTQHLLSSTFTGYDRNTPGSRVHGNLISGILDGTIYTNNDIYYIEPAHRYTRDTQHHSIVYRHSDINMDALRGARCGVSDKGHPSLVEYFKKMGRSMTTPVGGVTPGSQGTPEYRSKRQTENSLVRCDLNVTGDYQFFQEVTQDLQSLSVEAREEVALSLLVSYIQGASEIYKRTDFDGDPNTSDNIQFGIRAIVIETTPSPPPFDNEFIGVERFLQQHSERSNFEENFCLNYRFTHRDFDGGVLGLAYVAKENSRGGICQNELNTGIVTTLNYGQRVPPQVTVLTFAHEAGHNFGSEHDPEGTDCTPGGSDGNFVMYAFASNGRQDNNNRFSTCSREMMQVFIQTRGQNGDNACFSDAADVCQNSILDDGEACDCGIEFSRDTHLCRDDPCCNGTSCRLVDGAMCSRDQGPCCDSSTCRFFDSTTLCANLTDCGLPSDCTGDSAVCPAQEARTPDEGLGYRLCNNGTATCEDNECTGSFCVVLNTTQCSCPAKEEECHLCCQLEVQGCVSTITLADTDSSLLPGGIGQQLPVGAPCNNFRGYCDFLNNCFQVDSEGALDRLTNLFSPANVNQAVSFVRNKWWAVLVGGLGLLIGIFVLILIVHLVLPRPEHMKARAERRQTIRRSKNVGGAHPEQGNHEMRMWKRRQNT